MTQMKLYSFEDLKDKKLGKIGTPERDRYEQELAKDLLVYHIGEAIKKQARKANNLTQEELSKKIGVQRAQISRLENGKHVSIHHFIIVKSNGNTHNF